MTLADALLALVVFAGFTVESTIGFGATVVTVTLGSMLLPVDTILAAFVPVNVLLSTVLVARNARAVDRRLLVTKILPWMGLGLPLGFYLGRTLDPRALKALFGVFVVTLSAVELRALLRKQPEGARVEPVSLPAPAMERPLPPWIAATLLTLGGLVHGAFATGGPMAVYVSGRYLDDKARFRATLSALWLVLNVALLAGYVARHQINATSLPRSAAMLLALPFGITLGEWLHRRVAIATFRLAINVMLFVIGCVLVVRR